MRRSALVLTIVVVVTGALSAGDKDKAATTKTTTTKPAATRPATATAKAPDNHVEKLTGQGVLKAMGTGFKAAVERIPGGEIDWTRDLVIASGTAKATGADNQAVAMARRGARLLAARNAILLTRGIRVGPGGKFPQIKQGRISVDAVVKGLRELSWKFDRKAMTVTVTAGVPIYGADGIVRMTAITFAKHARAFVWPAVAVLAPGAAGARADVVIIDGRGTGFLPCLAPRITDDSGGTVFSLTQLGTGEFQKRGMVVYLCPAEAVKWSPTDVVGPRVLPAAKKAYRDPVVLRADKSPKNSPGTLVLTSTATKTLMISGDARDLFRSGRVIVVTDTPPVKK